MVSKKHRWEGKIRYVVKINIKTDHIRTLVVSTFLKEVRRCRIDVHFKDCRLKFRKMDPTITLSINILLSKSCTMGVYSVELSVTDWKRVERDTLGRYFPKRPDEVDCHPVFWQYIVSKTGYVPLFFTVCLCVFLDLVVRNDSRRGYGVK